MNMFLRRTKDKWYVLGLWRQPTATILKLPVFLPAFLLAKLQKSKASQSESSSWSKMAAAIFYNSYGYIPGTLCIFFHSSCLLLLPLLPACIAQRKKEKKEKESPSFL
jgi:hypothetical protein